jgi:hypothetical protein
MSGKVSMGAKEDESSTGRVWAAGFHHVTARSRLARGLKLANCLFLFSGRSKLRILNQRIRGHDRTFLQNFWQSTALQLSTATQNTRILNINALEN